MMKKGLIADTRLRGAEGRRIEQLEHEVLILSDRLLKMTEALRIASLLVRNMGNTVIKEDLKQKLAELNMLE